DPELVLMDVINEYITIDEAREIYGVIIDKETLKINLEKTKQTREKLKEHREEYIEKLAKYIAKKECEGLPIYEWFPG
ncbi:MAG TPA: hypothetical protein VNL13_08900, partial [Sulfolobales archaeon]|nr:hypothetical protein [Sulfolobales archaeon]